MQIRATFHLPDDLTEEEKLEPIKNLGDDSRIRLLNRLYSKRRKVRRHSLPRPPDELTVACLESEAARLQCASRLVGQPAWALSGSTGAGTGSEMPVHDSKPCAPGAPAWCGQSA